MWSTTCVLSSYNESRVVHHVAAHGSITAAPMAAVWRPVADQMPFCGTHGGHHMATRDLPKVRL